MLPPHPADGWRAAPRRRHLARSLTGAAFAVVGLTLLVACADDEPDTPTATTPTAPATSTTAAPSSTTTTTAPMSPEQEVEVAYLEIVRRDMQRMAAPDPDDPDIDRDHLDPMRGVVRSRQAQLAADGQSVITAEDRVPAPQVIDVRLGADRAVIRNCVIDTGRTVENASGRVVDDKVVSYLLDSVLLRSGERWKVAEQITVSSWPDGAGCDR